MVWDELFGEFWFWAAAALLWTQAISGAFGAPRKLITQALTEPGAALMARDLVRWRLLLGRRFPLSLSALRWPLLGAAAAYAIAGAFQGAYTVAALAAAFGPLLAANTALEPRVAQAIEASREGDPLAFADVLEQAWRIRVAAVALGVVLSAGLARLTAP